VYHRVVISRRTVLKFGLGGAAVLAVSAATPLPALAMTGLEPEDVSPLQVLSERELVILEAIAETIAPGGDGFPTASQLGVARQVDTLLVQLPPGDAEDLRAAIRLFDSPAALLLLGTRPRSFTRMSPEARVAVLERWRTGAAVKRKVYKAVQALCASAYWSNPRVYEGVGYPGPPDFKHVVPDAERDPDDRGGWTPEEEE